MKSGTEQLGRRALAAFPELMLAWYCFQSAGDVLAGGSADGYVLGILFMESLGISALWLILHGHPQRWRSVFGAGRALLTAIVLFFSMLFGGIALLALLFIDFPLFIALATILFRRILWLWSWRINAVENREALVALSRRLSRVQMLAVGLAAGVAVLLRLSLEGGADSTVFGDGMWLAGMAAYFVALSLYILAGKQPELQETARTRAARPVLAGVPPPEIGRISGLLTSNWPGFLPAIGLLWIFIALSDWLLGEDLLTLLSPILIAFGALPMLAMAAHTLGVPQAARPGFAWRRRNPCVLTVLLLWFISLLLMFVAMPVVAGILQLEITTALGDDPAFQFGMMVAGVGIAFLALRLWPAFVLPFLLPEDVIPDSSTDLLRHAWIMTSDLDGLFRGGAAPLVILAPALWLLHWPQEWALAGETLVYLLLAPLLALVMVERSLVMSKARLPLPLLLAGQNEADTSHGQD